MFRIAVCDDERIFATELSQHIKEYMDVQGSAYTVDTFYTLFDLERALKAEKYDLLFLDILIRSESGMEFAKKLRANGEEIDIVFVSSNTDYALEAFSVFPVTFLPKPVTKKDVNALMQKMTSRVLKRPTVIVNDKQNGKTIVQCDSVCYLESQGHDIVMQLSTRETLRFSGVFSEFVNELPVQQFFRCHRSYIVNMRYVHRMQNCRFVMSDGSIIPIAKPSYKEAMDRFASIMDS